MILFTHSAANPKYKIIASPGKMSSSDWPLECFYHRKWPEHCLWLMQFSSQSFAPNYFFILLSCSVTMNQPKPVIKGSLNSVIILINMTRQLLSSTCTRTCNCERHGSEDYTVHKTKQLDTKCSANIMVCNRTTVQQRIGLKWIIICYNHGYP